MTIISLDRKLPTTVSLTVRPLEAMKSLGAL